ncbi:hypothetical protein BsWGS_13735 [Bradybaena similaris]
MSRFHQSLFCVTVMLQMISITFCAKTVLLGHETSSNRSQHNQHQHTKPKTDSEHHSIDKREIVGYTEDKRLRDFVGKRTQPELSDLQALPSVHGFVELPLEAVVDYEERQLAGRGDEREAIEEELGQLSQFPSPQTSFGDSYFLPPYSKRLRDFVGKRDEKRLRDFVGKRLRDFVGKRGIVPYDSGFINEKRLRDFVGKRDVTDNNAEDELHSDISKRLRDFVGKRDLNSNFRLKRAREFVGKRDDISKRLRDFVGKRAMYYPIDVLPSYDKRLRDFVGKREGFQVFDEVKRLRDFVGKRDGGDIFEEDKRLRDFVGKRDDKRAREFVGKRDDKRAREFVGKRDDDKRAREFVGKRQDKRPREFVGKRDDDKRAREFVGKRFQFDDDREEELSAFKRLRDFVGKRSELSDLETAEVGKRLRDFVGRR